MRLPIGWWSSAKGASATTAATDNSGAAMMAIVAPMLTPNRARGPRPRDRRNATAAAREVELQDVMVLVQPRHERRQLREAVAGEAVQDDHRRARVPRGRNQPTRKGDSVIGREPNRLVVEADVGRRGREALDIRLERPDLWADEHPRA